MTYEPEGRAARMTTKEIARAPLWALGLFLGALVVLGGAGRAEALCPAGFNDAGTECQLNADITATGTLVFDKTVHLLAGSSITAQTPTGFTLQINAGNFVMETGSELSGDQPGCPGGQGTIGAPITVNLQAGQGNVEVKQGASIHSNACAGGFIQILTAGRGTVDIDGLVESVGRQSGTSNGRPGGGPITIVAGCELNVNDTGVVSSRGRNPGADLVHLEGCVVTIFGLVESTGPGHSTLVNNPALSCSDVPSLLPRRNPVTRPGKPQNSTACVEIWAGQTVLIDATGTHRGEVRADTGATGGAGGTSWIEILANGDITIRDGAGNDVAPNNSPREGFAVHANGLGNTTDEGGLVDVISRLGSLFTFGKALQASHVGVGGGGGGGTVTVQVNVSAVLGTAEIEARGKDFGGGVQHGGVIDITASTQQITGASPGELDAFGGPPLGSVTLQACTANPAVTYTGTSTPPATNIQQCSPAPVFPSYATPFPADNCDDVCQELPSGLKKGIKFNDLNGVNGRQAGEPTLQGWTIVAFIETAPGSGMFVESLSATTNAAGEYSFTLQAGVNYIVCEVLQATWTQTFPSAAGGNVVSCAGLTSALGPLGPLGYAVNLGPAETEDGNDFGNNRPQPPDGECPKFPALQPDSTITINPNVAGQIQAAIDALPEGKTLLILPHLGATAENIVISKKVTVVGCSVTLTAADASQPVVRITAGANQGTTIDVHATGSAVAGYHIAGAGHTVKNTRSFDNAIGFWITGNGNTVTGAQGTDGNGIGFKIDGDANVVDSATGVTNSLGNGAQISVGADGNTIKKSTFTGNNGEGILVQGGSSTISENKLYSNAANGILVTGGANSLLKNKAGEVGKGNGQNGIRVTGNNGPLTENTAVGNGANGIQVTGTGHNLRRNQNKDNAACEFAVAAGNLDGGQNKANDVGFTFPAGGVACQE